MAELLADFSAWMEALPPLWAYVTLLAIAYGENIVPPVPGDMAVVFAGYLAGIGKLNLLAVIGLGVVGGTLGFMTVYAVGRRLGRAVLEEKRFQWLPRAQVEKAESWVRRRGYAVVAANRFLSGVRSVISLTVGMVHMDPWKTAACATFSAAVWVTLIAYAGYAVGDHWAVVQDYLQTYGQIVLGALLLLVVVQGVRFYRRRKTSRKETSKDA